MSSLSSANHTTRRTHNPLGRLSADHPGVVKLGRAGWFAKGAVYLIAGYLILSVASKAQGWTDSAAAQEASPTGAIKTVADSSGGPLLLWVLAIGMLLYAGWRVVTALLPGKTDVEAWVHRIGYVVSAIIYTTFALSAVALARSASTQPDGNKVSITIARPRSRHDRRRLDRHGHVNVDQSTRIAIAFARQAALSPMSSLCNACVDVLAVTGAGITVMGGGQAGPMCVSNQRMAALEDLQFTLGEGPCQDAYRSGVPVHAPRLDVATFARWPSFVERAQAAGFGGVFAFPLSLQGANVGVLTLYQDLEGDLSAAQTEDSIAMSEVLTETLLSLQDVAPTGELAAGLEDAVSYRAQVHQATGMVSLQLKIPIADALVRIRAHAYTAGRAVADVAADIVGRRLRLIDDHLLPREEV